MTEPAADGPSHEADSWYHEKESAWLYRRVAAAETDPHKSELFLKLAAAAEEQAARWQLSAAQSNAAAAGNPRQFVPRLRARCAPCWPR